MATQWSSSSWGRCFRPWVSCLLCCLRIKDLLSANLLPAVAARFGIGKDFWLNLLLTICGYIPGMLIMFVLLRCPEAHPLGLTLRPFPQFLHPGLF